MNNEAYVNLILQKHRLAISLAVIRTKPENITLNEHIQQLRNIMKKGDMDEDNHSICSEDFFIDETNDNEMYFDKRNDIDINIDETNDVRKNVDNNDRNDYIITQITDKNYYCTVNTLEIVNTQDMITHTRENLDKTQVPESENDGNDRLNETNDVEMIDTQNLNDSITILENFDNGNELDEINDEVVKGRSSLDDVMDILRGIGDDMTTIEKAVSNRTPSKSTRDILLTQFSDGIDNTQCFTDIDATQCDSLDIVEAVDKHISQKHSCNLNKKQSDKSTKEDKTDKRTKPVVDFEKTNVNKVQTNINTEFHNSKINKGKTSQNGSEENGSDIKTRLKNTEKETQKLKDYRHLKEYKNVYKNVADLFTNIKNEDFNQVVKAKSSDKTKTLDKIKDIGKNLDKTNISGKMTDVDIIQDVNTQLIYKHDTEDSTCKTHYSQSQINDIIPIEGKYIYGTKRNINEPNQLENEKKKKKEDIFILEDEFNQNNKKEIAKTKNLSIVDNICLPEVRLTKITKKADFEINSKSAKEKLINEAKTASELQQESQIYYTNPNHSSSKFNENNAKTFENTQDNNVIISNAVYVSSDKLNAKNNMLYANESILNANDISLNANKDKLNAKNNMLYAKESMLNANISLNDNPLDETTSNPDSILKANLNQNAQNRVKNIDKDLFSEESLTNFTFSTEAFENISDDSFGFSQYFGNIETKNYKASDKENLSKRCAIFDESLDNTPTDKLRNNFVNSQNTQAGAKYDENKPENKTCVDFDNSNTAELPEHMNTEIDHKTIPTDGCTISEDNEDLTDSQIEKIPFKIIEELNKVKIFLNKRNEKNLKGYSSDTGYRSDTNSRNSLKLSSSNTGLDQSAHCIYNYIKQSPLHDSIQDITEEISLALGQLIDKLHEEEIYPSFLEDILQSIQQMLETIYQDNDDENMLAKKDESIHRIILLNKSRHLQMYTIDKITHTLENLHTQLTTNDSYEMQNIQQIENTCYIFHLLEIILQKYNKTSHDLSQSTQLSQNTQDDEKSLKKSNIMDIWRKKWNPNHQETELEDSEEKKCVFNYCNTVLNKLIVDCMEGYSLISYFALKCFNVMQT